MRADPAGDPASKPDAGGATDEEPGIELAQGRVGALASLAASLAILQEPLLHHHALAAAGGLAALLTLGVEVLLARRLRRQERQGGSSERAALETALGRPPASRLRRRR